MRDKVLEHSSEALGFALKVVDGTLVLTDRRSDLFNVVDGCRVTHGAPEDASAVIYIVGPSYAMSAFCDDKNTLASHLQYICNERVPGRKYKVQNCGISGGSLAEATLRVAHLPLKAGDIVIAMAHTENLMIPVEDRWEVVKTQQLLCREKGADYCFFLYPRWDRTLNPTEYEKKRICNSYKSLYEKNISLEYSPPERYTPPSILQKLTAAGCPCYDLQHCIERPHSLGELLVDKDHVCAKGHKLFAEVVFASFIRHLEKKYPDTTRTFALCYMHLALALRQQYADDERIKKWLNRARPKDFYKNRVYGCIVMNCNPFTRGHLYIIEEALKSVDFLYILIVQEDLSEFTLFERMKLVQQGTKHLGDRVIIRPSGHFVISNLTFPEYFEKKELATESVDTTTDVTFFGAIIAPALGIRRRFVGDEPLCNVTSQYNESLKSILPYMGVAVKETPRLMENGKAISASLVRKCLASGEWEKIKKLVPPTTFEFLLEKHGRQPEPLESTPPL